MDAFHVAHDGMLEELFILTKVVQSNSNLPLNIMRFHFHFAFLRQAAISFLVDPKTTPVLSRHLHPEISPFNFVPLL